MQQENNHSGQKVIVGLGQTGLSCAKYLTRKKIDFIVLDSRKTPPGLEELRQMLPGGKIKLGEFEEADLVTAEEIIVSPGVDLRSPVLQSSIAKGIPITGDIDIFAKETKAPIIAVTGSNAKSTVVTLLGEMAKESGIKVAVAGNIGKPVLDVLAEGDCSLNVLEISSFQLETTTNLNAEVATVLNISPDHMDRYDSMQAYHQAKHRIFQGCKQAVVNSDDMLSQPLLSNDIKQWHFGIEKKEGNEFCVIEQDKRNFLSYCNQALLNIDELKIAGLHNVSNALAALALGNAAGLKFGAMLVALKNFPGLPHRCQWVAEVAGVNYYNDSKGTNVGACIAAIEGLSSKLKAGNKIILIAGGIGKGAEFSEIARVLENKKSLVILLGDAADQISKVLSGKIEMKKVSSLAEAVDMASINACVGDLVLLSPACASFDMFKNYEERGAAFIDAVTELH